MTDQIYKVRDPAGNIREIRGPAGATDEQVIAQAKTLFAEPEKVAPPGGKFPVDIQPFNPSVAERIAAHPITRGVMGAGSAGLGVIQAAEKINPVSRLLGTDKWLDENIQSLETMKKSGGHEGIDWAGMLGAVATPMGALSKLPMAASRLGRVGQGSAVGAGVGATTPVTDPENFAGSKAQQTAIGAVLGPLAPAVISGGAKAIDLARNLLPGGTEKIVSDIWNKAAGPKRDELVRLLRENREIVPGSKASAGEVGAPAGSAEFSALQRIAETKNPTEYGDMGKAQDAARVAAVRSVGGTPEGLARAIRTRSENATENYGAVRGDMVSPKSDVELMQDAITQRATSQADALKTEWQYKNTAKQQEILANGGVIPLSSTQPVGEPKLNRGIGGGEARSPSAYPVEGQPRIPARYTENAERVPEAKATAAAFGDAAQAQARTREFLETQMEMLSQTAGMSDRPLSSLLSRPSMREAVKDMVLSANETGAYFPKQAGDKFTVQNLQRIKESLDAGIAAASKATEAGRRPELSPAELEGTKKAFIEWASNKSPGWANARQQYQLDSLPIDRMRVGQSLEGKLTAPVTDLEGPAKQRAGMYAAALRDEPGTIKRATGTPRFKDLSEIFPEREVDTLMNVGRDLGRGAEKEDLARKGMSAAGDIIGLSIPKVPAGGMFSPHYSVARAILNRFAGKMENRSLEMMAEKMRDPQEVARIMELTPPQRKAYVEALLQQGGRALTVGASSGSARQY